ncbi:DAP kinase-related apoptosis-inducing protein kinase 2 [Intoshia linei]|uniref:DAP kinase-related apoptosis-inducing protein kinase 2 n=1 Tax=Intoshia linei TaxID=1819745 RepID=A0A177ATI9_9BILA|nr:DAP kinase-related apoptosis-inducing protein kinase 2 [Intoshia linei]
MAISESEQKESFCRDPIDAPEIVKVDEIRGRKFRLRKSLNSCYHFIRNGLMKKSKLNQTPTKIINDVKTPISNINNSIESGLDNFQPKGEHESTKNYNSFENSSNNDEIDLKPRRDLIIKNLDDSTSYLDTIKMKHIQNTLSVIPTLTTSYLDKYIIEQRIATGRFGVVSKVKKKSCDENNVNVKYYAAKRIRKSLINRLNDEIGYYEADILKLVQGNTSFINLHEIYNNKRELVLITDFISGGELENYLDGINTNMENKEIVRVIYQTCSALIFMHSNNILHLDIKPANILLYNIPPTCNIKLCDFGLSRRLKCNEKIRMICGTPQYTAPEIIAYEPIEFGSDMWSVGVLAFKLISGNFAFMHNDEMHDTRNITSIKYSFDSNFTLHQRQFIASLFHLKPNNRLSATECIQQPWMQSYS